MSVCAKWEYQKGWRGSHKDEKTSWIKIYIRWFKAFLDHVFLAELVPNLNEKFLFFFKPSLTYLSEVDLTCPKYLGWTWWFWIYDFLRTLFIVCHFANWASPKDLQLGASFLWEQTMKYHLWNSCSCEYKLAVYTSCQYCI